MHQTKFSIDLVSECSILIRFDETISENSIGQLARAMNQHLSHIVMNIVPSYRTVLIDYLPFRISEFQLVDILHNILVALCHQEVSALPIVRPPFTHQTVQVVGIS